MILPQKSSESRECIDNTSCCAVDNLNGKGDPMACVALFSSLRLPPFRYPKK